MEGLADGYQVAALDTRGYNRSDKPTGVENYDMALLVGDVASVIANERREHAIIVGHDWGGMIAWSFAMGMPQMTEKLVIVNLPHPAGMSRELANNEEQQKNSQYSRVCRPRSCSFTAWKIQHCITTALIRPGSTSIRTTRWSRSRVLATGPIIKSLNS